MGGSGSGRHSKYNPATQELGVHFSTARQNKGMTLADVALAVGCDKGTIHNYEHGKSVPPLDIAVRIAKAYGVTLDYLAGLGS